MQHVADRSNVQRLGWNDLVIPARLLGVSHATLRAFLATPGAPPPNVLVSGLLRLPPALLPFVSAGRWPKLHRPLDEHDVWLWRCELCMAMCRATKGEDNGQ